MNIKKQNIEFLSYITNNILKWTFKNYQNKIFCTTGFGANGVVLLNFIKKINKKIPIYFIDTGYHFKETINIKNYYKKNGFNIIDIESDINHKKNKLYKIDADLCCSINKIEPMKNIIENKKNHIWITAVSRDQTTTRNNFRYLSKNNDIIKVCPLLNWKEDEIWNYIINNNIKYNKLYDKGYKSIGCMPCTTIIEDGENSRSGRWKGLDKDECGLQTMI